MKLLRRRDSAPQIGVPPGDGGRQAEAAEWDRPSERFAGDSEEGTRTEPVSPDEGPSSPSKLTGNERFAAFKRAVRESQRDSIIDWAAALTYYGVLSIFPALLVLFSAIGLLGQTTADRIQQFVQDTAPGQMGDFLVSAISQVRESSSTASLVAILGLLVAFWSASGYIGAFMRAANAIYDVPEGRPIWKKLPIRLGVTALIGLMLLVSLLIVIFTGDFARQVGDAIGLGSTAVTVWSIAKWPVLVILVSLMFSVLYWASPNARQGGFHWITPGGVVAVIVWLIASAGFALYVANFASYNKTYGAIAGAIIFLVWLWLTNIAILFGAEIDAELERGRAMAAGHDGRSEPFLELRDDRKVKDTDPVR